MKPTTILKQTYYALTSGMLLIALTVFLSVAFTPMGRSMETMHPIKYPLIIMAFSIGYCWLMRRHNGKYEWLIYCSIILLSFFFCMKVPLYYPFGIEHGIDRFWWSAASNLLDICTICMMVATFGSNTKYYNILPNQSVTVSKVFRVTSWVGQVIVWGLAILDIGVKYSTFR